MQDNAHLKKIITLPNILSLVRLLLIPVFCVVYVSMGKYKPAAAILLLSGLTDVVDGFVARRFNMVSDLGKVLDPAADKLTQLAVLACLISRFKRMSLPCIMLAAKELISGISSALAVKKTGLVHARTCSVCSTEEEANHNIPSGSVTCTDCGSDIIN